MSSVEKLAGFKERTVSPDFLIDAGREERLRSTLVAPACSRPQDQPRAMPTREVAPAADMKSSWARETSLEGRDAFLVNPKLTIT
jgi:hypothetical protein